MKDIFKQKKQFCQIYDKEKKEDNGTIKSESLLNGSHLLLRLIKRRFQEDKNQILSDNTECFTNLGKLNLSIVDRANFFATAPAA